MTPRGRITLRSAKDSEARSAARPHRGQPRGGSPPAAHAQRADACTPRDSSSRRADAASSGAPSSRRSARTSPKSARWRSTRANAGKASARLIVEELRRRARAEGFEKLCAFTHAPALFHPDGILDRPATWVLEKSRRTASSARSSARAASTRWWCRSTRHRSTPIAATARRRSRPVRMMAGAQASASAAA